MTTHANDGDRNAPLFDRWEALTFDDVVIVPGYSDVLPDTADTTGTARTMSAANLADVSTVSGSTSL